MKKQDPPVVEEVVEAPVEKAPKAKRRPKFAKKQKEKSVVQHAPTTSAAAKQYTSNAFHGLHTSMAHITAGYHINLLGSNLAIRHMFIRLQEIALRPLEALLEIGANVSNYRKVCAYLLFARVCAAQLMVNDVEHRNAECVNAITADAYNVIRGKTEVIPNFMSWMLSHIGIFQMGENTYVPLLPNPEAEADVTINDVMTGNYRAICIYINRHRPGDGGVDIPEADVVHLNTLSTCMPIFCNDENTRFTAATSDLWQNDIRPAEWNSFTKINLALQRQSNTVSGYVLTEALGSEANALRHERFTAVNEKSPFYSKFVISDLSMKASIALRLGVDTYLEERLRCDPLLTDPIDAPCTGSDAPGQYIQLQLEMLKRSTIR